MTIEKKLEKRIKTIVQMTGEYPEQIEVTQEEYDELASKNSDVIGFTEVLDKERQPLNKFMGIKLKIKK